MEIKKKYFKNKELEVINIKFLKKDVTILKDKKNNSYFLARQLEDILNYKNMSNILNRKNFDTWYYYQLKPNDHINSFNRIVNEKQLLIVLKSLRNNKNIVNDFIKKIVNKDIDTDKFIKKEKIDVVEKKECDVIVKGKEDSKKVLDLKEMETKTYYFGKTPIKVFIDKNNKFYFLGSEITKMLGYKNSSSKLSKISNKNQLIKNNEKNCFNKLIGEDDLFKLIMSSKLETASKFKDWVTSEVLPSIMKQGNYDVKTPKTYKEAVQQLLLEIEKNEKLVPKVEAYNRVIDTDDTILLGDFAKVYFDELKFGKNAIFKKLRELGILDHKNKPYQKYMHFFEVFEKVVAVDKGKDVIKFVTKLKASKQEDLFKILKNKLKN